MYSKPPEFRLNYLKNFNHFNKDQMGAMGIFGPRSNTEINRIKDDIFDREEAEEDIDDSDIDVEVDNDEGLKIGGEEEIIPRTHSYPYGFGSPPSQTFKDNPGIRSKTSATIFTFEQFSNIDLDLDFKEIHRVSDGHFNMILKDVERKNNEIILHVLLEEVSNPNFNGSGTFRYIMPNTRNLIGDIYPIKLNGILEDVFLDDPEPIIDFIINIIKDVF